MRKILILFLILCLFISVWAYLFNDGKVYDFTEAYGTLMKKFVSVGDFGRDIFNMVVEGDFSVVGKWLNKIGESIMEFAKDMWDTLWGIKKPETVA